VSERAALLLLDKTMGRYEITRDDVRPIVAMKLAVILDDTREPCWVPCPHGCGEYWCEEHLQHVADCPCPPVEEWGKDPYLRRHDESL